ncbi:unnamed protein product [Angiostrongylus costaricensis]|uniref:SCP domain-containing protein n=1 Tax=Angiostrongylus costaricensis TaxID=334426 RepID=A0A0R3PGN0_ANGCS|nr:unnamed protein product [Angiostrongylus costaricensis]
MGQTCLKSSPTTASLWKWIGIANAGWPSTNVFNGNEALRAFDNIVNANATAVGCYGAFCDDRVSPAYVFSQRERRTGTLVYTFRESCENGRDVRVPEAVYANMDCLNTV